MTAKERERPLPGILATDTGTGVCGLPCRPSCRSGMRQTPYRLRLRPLPCRRAPAPARIPGSPRALASGLQLASPVRIKYIERLRMPFRVPRHHEPANLHGPAGTAGGAGLLCRHPAPAALFAHLHRYGRQPEPGRCGHGLLPALRHGGHPARHRPGPDAGPGPPVQKDHHLPHRCGRDQHHHHVHDLPAGGRPRPSAAWMPR